VADLKLQSGPFWDAVCIVRAHWNITARQTLPSKEDLDTYYPVEQAPTGKDTKARLKFDDQWDDSLRSLKERFVPDRLRRGPAWDEFFGACLLCDPPDKHLMEFAEFGAVYPRLFWPTVDCEIEEIDLDNVPSMVAPPIKRIFKESYEEGEPFFEYHIVVDEETTVDDVKRAFRAIRAACNFKGPGGKPRMDKLVALCCAILYDYYNGVDPEDNRFKLWTYEKLAGRFKKLGVKNRRSAEEHVKYGRELRKARNKIEKNRFT